MYWFRLRSVELTVHYTAAGRHLLDLVRPQHLDVSHAVLVGQFAFQNVAQDLHVAVSVGSKAASFGYAVFVDHAQRAIAHVLGVVIVGKRKCVVRIEPAVVGMASFVTLAYCQHDAFIPFFAPAERSG